MDIPRLVAFHTAPLVMDIIRLADSLAKPVAATTATAPLTSSPVSPSSLHRASFLSKHNFKEYRSMFGLYLDIQKNKALEELPEEEVRGRWKSFVGKWNRGELAEGWYDPGILQKAKASTASATSLDQGTQPKLRRHASPVYHSRIDEVASSEEEELGPSLPSNAIPLHRRQQNPGPVGPKRQDIDMQRGLEPGTAHAQREVLLFDRRQDGKAQKERLEELLPRAEAGSKDRLLEKRREKADAHRAFAAGRAEAGDVIEVPESDLLGDEDGGLHGFKKRKMEMQRKKNERELRKEAILRERAADREERARAYREKEARTMSGLVALAKAKFGE
ncbi:MAG: hypothetical protein Q9163_003323 [Psora crenata]